VGVAVAATTLIRGRISLPDVRRTLDLPVLSGLFGMAVALGTLGRNWTGPASALRHLDPWATAAVGAVSTVLVNNLPAAALLSARPPRHPLSLLIGLDIGPNLFVSGSLAWVLWYSSAKAAGATPDVARTVKTGLAAAPLAMVAAVGALLLVASGS
jgi:arsenical pump membrane protein